MNANALMAMDHFLETKYPRCKIILLSAMNMPPEISTVVKGRFELPQSTIDTVNRTSQPTILLPINLDRVHWACMVLDRITQRIPIYDSLSCTKTKKYMGKLADNLSSKCDASSYTRYVYDIPIQNDGSSCGFFV